MSCVCGVLGISTIQAFPRFVYFGVTWTLNLHEPQCLHPPKGRTRLHWTWRQWQSRFSPVQTRMNLIVLKGTLTTAPWQDDSQSYSAWAKQSQGAKVPIRCLRVWRNLHTETSVQRPAQILASMRKVFDHIWHWQFSGPFSDLEFSRFLLWCPPGLHSLLCNPLQVHRDSAGPLQEGSILFHLLESLCFPYLSKSLSAFFGSVFLNFMEQNSTLHLFTQQCRNRDLQSFIQVCSTVLGWLIWLVHGLK